MLVIAMADVRAAVRNRAVAASSCHSTTLRTILPSASFNIAVKHEAYHCCCQRHQSPSCACGVVHTTIGALLWTLTSLL